MTINPYYKLPNNETAKMTIWTPWQIKPEIDTNLDPKEVGYPSTIAQIEKTVPAEHYHDFGVYQKVCLWNHPARGFLPISLKLI